MNISFNKIPQIKLNIQNNKTPSFKSNDLGEDKFVKSSQSTSGVNTDDVSSVTDLTKNLFDLIDDVASKYTESLLDVIKDDLAVSAFMSVFSDKSRLSFLKQTIPNVPFVNYLDQYELTKGERSACLKYFSEAGVETCQDFARVLETYNMEPVKKVFAKAPITYLKIYSALDNKKDIYDYPELLLTLHDIFSDKKDIPHTDFYNGFPQCLKDIGCHNLDEFKEKFNHLAPEYKDFEEVGECVLALFDHAQTYLKKIELLEPVADNLGLIKNEMSVQNIYATIPDIVDTLFKQNNGENLGDIEEYLTTALARKDLNRTGMTMLKPYFNDFNTPEDKIRFYKFLNDNNITVNKFKKIFSKIIITDVEAMPLIHNRQSIVEALSQKDKMNKTIAEDMYTNFADVLNVAYSAQGSSIDVLSGTFELIKNAKLKNSSDLLNLYNQCNIPHGKAKTISNEEFVDFIDLMTFVDKDVFKDPKKLKKLRLDDLRQTKQEFENVKVKIENFLMNNSQNLFLHQTPFSIFTSYKSDLIGATDEKIEAFLYELDKFNIKDDNENKMKNLQIDRLQGYFPSRKDVLSFVILNEISFDNTKEDEEYRLNCIRVLKNVYKPYAPEESFEIIKKLSDSKFLLNSKNSLNDLANRNLTQNDCIKLINTLLDKNVRTYSLFENFVKDYSVDENSFDKLLEFLTNTPQKVSFADVTSGIRQLQYVLNKSNYPVSVNADNLSNLSYDDLLNCKDANGSIKPEILNKLLGLQKDVNPVLSLPNVHTNKVEHDRFGIALEILSMKNGLEAYPKLTKFFFNVDKVKDLTRNQVKQHSEELPDYFVDFVNTMFKSSNGQNYNIALHAKLRIIERFLMDNIKSQEDFLSANTQKTLETLLHSIYDKEQLLIKSSKEGERILFNSIYQDKVIETVFNKSGMLITAVEKSH